MKNKFKFTVLKLQALKCPSDKTHVYFYDAKQGNLAIRINRGGRKVFVLYRSISGKPERINIGRFPDWTIEQARKKARKLNVGIDEGYRPSAARRAQAKEPTLRDLFQDYTAARDLSPITIKNYKSTFGKYLSHIASCKISTIQTRDIRALFDKITRTGAKVPANKMARLMRALFLFAARQGYDVVNPSAGIELHPERARDRFLRANELEAFFQALAEQDLDRRHYFMLLLLTAARRSNVESMKWTDIDWAERVWIIPAEQMKGQRESHIVPLTDQVIEILKERKRSAEGEYVFPSEINKGEHFKSPKRAWTALVKRAGLKNLRMHDLRRSAASWAASTGASLPTVGAVLGHRTPAVTQIYSKVMVEPQREALEKATAAMMKAGKQAPKDASEAEVVDIDGQDQA